MKNMTVAEMIKRYDLQLFGSDQIRAGFTDLAKKEDAVSTLRENKAKILEMLKAAEEEKKTEKAARDAELARMIEVTICGWEAETVYIDPEKALEDQVPGKSTLEYIGISADQALCQIKDAIIRKAEKKAQEIRSLEEEISSLEGKDLPSAAEAKVLRKTGTIFITRAVRDLFRISPVGKISRPRSRDWHISRKSNKIKPVPERVNTPGDGGPS